MTLWDLMKRHAHEVLRGGKEGDEYINDVAQALGEAALAGLRRLARVDPAIRALCRQLDAQPDVHPSLLAQRIGEELLMDSVATGRVCEALARRGAIRAAGQGQWLPGKFHWPHVAEFISQQAFAAAEDGDPTPIYLLFGADVANNIALYHIQVAAQGRSESEN